MQAFPVTGLRCLSLAILALTITSPALAAGALDTSFGNGGRVITDLGGNDGAYGTALQSDGRIVVVGGSDSRLKVLRYSAAGVLDPSFGVGGVATVAPLIAGTSAASSTVAVQADGRIVVGLNDAGGAFSALRLNANGSLDNGFGIGGRAVVPVFRDGQPAAGRVLKLLVLASGKIWLMGDAGIPSASEEDPTVPPGGETRATLVVLNANGTPDLTVGDAGVVNVGRADAGAPAGDVPFSGILDAVERPAGVVVVGAAGLPGQGNEAGLVIARLLKASGQYDTGFGSGGRTRLPAAPQEAFTSVVALPDGRLVAAGTAGALNSPLRLRRFSAEGMPDHAFAEPLVQVARQPRLGLAGGEQLWLGSERDTLINGDVVLRRIGGGGAVDAGFGSAGVLTVDFGATDVLGGLAVQPDGRVVLAGLRFGSSGDVGVARVDPQAVVNPPPPPPPPAPPAPPAAPTGLAATATSGQSITLAWTDRSNNETGFVIERSTSPGFGTVVRVATTSANTVTFVNTGLTPRTTYYYRVFAFNAVGNSAAITASARTPRR